MAETSEANDWYRLIDATLNVAKDIKDARIALLTDRLLKAEARQWAGWKLDDIELQRLETIKRGIDLLRNPTSENSWPKAKSDIAIACEGETFPWPQIAMGIQEFLNSELASVAPKLIMPQFNAPSQQPKKTVKSPKKYALLPMNGLSISLPVDPKHIWLAIGDETGNWDYESTIKSKRGLVLIIGRLDVWQQIFNEQIDGQTVAKRMGQPLQQLPPECEKSTFHHGIDAFKLGAENVPPALVEELRQNLDWLAQHPALITLGFEASSADLYQHLTHSQDASQALAKGYAALLAYVMPFLDREDVLLLGFEGRSENAGTIAVRRSEAPRSLNSQDRLAMDKRGVLSALRDTLVDQLKQSWPHEGDWDKRFDLATLGVLLKDEKLNKLCPLRDQPDNAWKGLADLGASLLQAQSTQWAQHFAFEQTSTTHFLNLLELLS